MRLKWKGWGRLALCALVIFAFTVSFGVDMQHHVAHASHGHAAHGMEAETDYAEPVLSQLSPQIEPADEQTPASHSSFGDSSHCNLVLLVPDLLTCLPVSAGLPKRSLVQWRSLDRRWRLDKPPRQLS